jgi:hypothetical protein
MRNTDTNGDSTTFEHVELDSYQCGLVRLERKMDLLIEELGFLQVLYPLKKLREAAVYLDFQIFSSLAITVDRSIIF